MRSVVFGTAGHIDHGKTALVHALTGTDTDRLPEEKARGITIDLGFAALDAVAPDGQPFRIHLVDVPGHHAFVRNMLAGAGGIEAVLLVVAADDGPKAQTVEHLQICRLLGIQRGLVALTKRDAVSAERLAAAEQEIRQLVENTFLEGAPVVAVSALHKAGLDRLRQELGTLAQQVPPRRTDRVTRLPIDRVFSVRGFGTVATGTLQDGTVRAGESLQLQPGGRVLRVRGLQVQGQSRAETAAPNRVALNLSNVEVGELQRGDVLVVPETVEAVHVLDVELEALHGAPAFRHRQQVRVHAFAAESAATLLLYEDSVRPSSTPRPLARLRLARPLLVVPGDRFVLRQPSPALTLGGGTVLDAHPLPRLRKSTRAAWLRTLQDTRVHTGADASLILSRIQRRGADGIALRRLVAETGWSAAALQTAAKPALQAGLLVQTAQDLLLDATALRETEASFLRGLARAQDTAATRTELRVREHIPEAAFHLVLERLRRSGKVYVEGDQIRLASERDTTQDAPSLSSAARAVEEIYRRAGLASPLVTEITQQLKLSPADARSTVTALLRAGRLVRLGSDALLVHAEALSALREQLKSARGQTIDVGRFKQMTGLSRKHAIPLLEYLDGARVTRNVGGVRTVL